MTIVQVYAPTSANENPMEEFYKQLESTIKEIPTKDLLTIEGDWNATGGCTRFLWLGRNRMTFWSGRTQWKQRDFRNSHKGIKYHLVNTLFPHKICNRTTWHLPNGATYNQNDYILTAWRFKSSINRAKSRTVRGANTNSDHDLLIIATVKLKLKKKLEEPRPKTQVQPWKSWNICK